jgi:prevent-host-death family protein
MSLSLKDSILPMSELRANLEKVRNQLRKTPVVVTNNGRPDFGICDLETLSIAVQIKDLRDLLKKRARQRHLSQDAEKVFRELDRKYSG